MAPVNDNIADAITLTLPTVVNGTTVGATVDTSPSLPTGWDGQKEVWYRVVVSEPKWLRITSSGDAGFRPYIDVIAPLNGTSASSLDEIDQNAWPDLQAWYEAGEGGEPATQRCLLPVGVFYLAVMDWDFAGGEGDFTLDLEFVPIQPGDLEFSFDWDTANDPESTETTFIADPYSVLYMQVARAPEHGQPVSFEVRKTGTTPPGDDYDDRYMLPNPVAICTPINAQFVDFDQNYWNNQRATPQDNEPDHAGFPARKSVWFHWSGLTPGVPYDIWVESADDDFVLSVYEIAATLEELGPAVAEDDDSGVGNQPLVTVTPSGVDLVICVDSKGPGGAFTLNARLSSVTRPANDDFLNAQELPGTAGTVSGNLVGASYECQTPSAGDSAFPWSGVVDYQQSLIAIGGDVWYKFVPTGNDYTLTWTSPTGVRLTVYTDFIPGVPNLNQLLPYTAFSGTGSSSVYDDSGSVTFGVTPGTTYYVRVEQVDNVQDDIDFTWATPAPELGDDFVDAPDLTPSAPPDGNGSFDWDWDLTGAGEQPSEPKDNPADQVRSVWRKFTPEHDCTVYMKSATLGQFDVVPDGTTIDVWRGDTLGQLDLVSGVLGPTNRGDGFKLYFMVRLRGGEEYRIRISNKKTSPPAADTLTTIIEYEMDVPWTDADGWDSETGSTADWTDGVLTFSDQGYRSVRPWVGDWSSRFTFISFDVRLESEWSPTAADGPVLGRQPGPTTHYPWAGNRITLLRLHYEHEVYSSSTMALEIVGDRDGNSWLEMWNEVGGGGSVNRTIWNHFALPNAETEGGEWIHIDITPIGVYVNSRMGLNDYYQTSGRVGNIDWGPYRFPTREGWDPGDDPPETWTLQFQNMRVTDRLFDGVPLTPGPMISEFETRLMHLPTPALHGTSNMYPLMPEFLAASSGANPVTREAPNPSSNPNHQWDAVRLHDESAYWRIVQRDNSFRHNGFWVTFDAFPSTNESVVISVMREWSGLSFGYFDDLCRLEVNSLGELWIYPFRWFQRPGLPGYGTSPGDPLNFQPRIPEPKAQKIGQMVLNEAYWIETWIDFTFPWDAVMRVAVNEVECFPEYRAVVNQADESRVSAARYSGSTHPLIQFADHAVGTPTGTPGQSSGSRAYLGHVDAYFGPWFVGRGGTPTEPMPETWAGEPVGRFPIGAHAGAVYPAAHRTGTHRIPDASTLDKFETTPAAMAAACDGFFEYSGVRLYKGPSSVDKSLNYDLSLGTTGYSEYGWGAQPALPPVIVADGSGPVDIFGGDFSGENAIEWAHDPSGPGQFDYALYGQNWAYIYVGNAPPGGVREGGEPSDDGGNHFLVFAWVRRVGGSQLAQIDMCYGVRGDLGAGPTFQLTDDDWHWLYGQSYPNYDLSGGTDAFGAWEFAFVDTASKFHMKQIHQFMNAYSYPRFKVTTDNGASSFWLITPTEAVHTYLADDPTDAAWQAGIFMDNVCPFERWDRTGPNVPGLLGYPPTGISMGDYRPRRYVEVRPPTEADLEDMNVVPSALRVVVRGAGFGSGEWGDVSTARASGTLKVRMTHGNVRHVVHDFPMTTTDKTIPSQVIPMTPSGFSWQADRVSELTTRMGFHFNYHDKSLNDSYGYRVLQNGSAICKALAYEVFAETVPGPPICTVGGRWKSRLTRRI
jgi:hypothetical protein